MSVQRDDRWVEPASAWSDTAAMPRADGFPDLPEILSILWRGKWLMALCLILAMASAWVLLQKLPKGYTAGAEIMLNNRQTHVVDIESVVGDLAGHDMAANEQRVLTSERLLGTVIRRLRLDRDPEFNPSLRPPGPVSRMKARVFDLFSGGPLAAYLVQPKPVLHRVDDPESTHRAALEAFRAALEVRGVPRTRAIVLHVTTSNPAKSALIANALADLYIVDQLESKFEATRRASGWLSERIAELKAKVEASEAEIEAFKAEQAIADGQGSALTAQQIAELNTEMVSARAARAEAEARFAQISRRVKSGGIGAAADVVRSELVLALRAQLAEGLRREAELAARYGPKHPKMIDIRAEIGDARTAISAEVRTVIETLRNDVSVAAARESALEQSLSTLEGKSLVQSRKSVQLRQLQREADADRLIYENFLNRFRETSEQEELQDADARILNAAFPPQRASSPNRKKVVVLAAAAGLFLGILVVLMVERLNRGLRSAADLSVLTGRPVLASLPRSGFWRRRLGLLRAIKARPNAQLAEAVRKLRTSLFLSNVDRPPQVVMVTSAVAGEGKSTTALLFAHMTAQLGRSVILVDCDIRRPTLQDIAPPPVGGLVPALQRKVDVSDAICEMPDFGIHTLANRTASPQSADILSSDRFRDLIARLRQSYDMVILDAPPVLAVADAAAIGHVADTCIYAVRWNKTPRQVVQHGLYQLTGLGVNVAGCVLTRADPVREARYSYSRYGYGGEAARNAYA